MKRYLSRAAAVCAALFFLVAAGAGESVVSVVNVVLVLGGGILVAGLGWVLKKAADYFASKTDSVYGQGVIRRLAALAGTSVAEVERRYVAAIKKGREPDSPGGTKLTPEEQQYANNEALSVLKGFLGATGLKEIGKVLGLSTSNDIDSVLRSVIDEAHDNKRALSVAAGRVAPKVADDLSVPGIDGEDDLPL